MALRTRTSKLKSKKSKTVAARDAADLRFAEHETQDARRALRRIARRHRVSGSVDFPLFYNEVGKALLQQRIDPLTRSQVESILVKSRYTIRKMYDDHWKVGYVMLELLGAPFGRSSGGKPASYQQAKQLCENLKEPGV